MPLRGKGGVELKILGLFSFIILVALLGATTSFATTDLDRALHGLSVGAMVQWDQKRLEAMPCVSFAMAAYTAKPPTCGLDSPDLIGLFTTSLGQYPIVYRGIWLKVVVYPAGFKDLKGVEFDPTGLLKIDAKMGWEELTPEEGGGYALTYRASRLGALPLKFRVRHRDGRDKLTFLFFTATWTKGGSLPSALEVMIQREPAENPVGEGALPYLKGFLPATARAEGGQAMTQAQQIIVPAQKAEQTVVDEGSAEESVEDILPPDIAPSTPTEPTMPKVVVRYGVGATTSEAVNAAVVDMEPQTRVDTTKKYAAILIRDESRSGARYQIELEDGRTFRGVVVNEDGDNFIKITGFSNDFVGATLKVSADGKTWTYRFTGREKWED